MCVSYLNDLWSLWKMMPLVLIAFYSHFWVVDTSNVLLIHMQVRLIKCSSYIYMF